MAPVRTFTVEVRGLEGALAAFRDFPEQATEAMREEVTASGDRIAKHTELIVPVAEGFMRDHVSQLPSEDGLSVEVGWRDSVFLEAGLPFYPPYVEYGTLKMTAQPSLNPAFEEERPKFVEALRARLRGLTLPNTRSAQ